MNTVMAAMYNSAIICCAERSKLGASPDYYETAAKSRIR